MPKAALMYSASRQPTLRVYAYKTLRVSGVYKQGELATSENIKRRQAMFQLL